MWSDSRILGRGGCEEGMKRYKQVEMDGGQGYIRGLSRVEGSM